MSGKTCVCVLAHLLIVHGSVAVEGSCALVLGVCVCVHQISLHLQGTGDGVWYMTRVVFPLHCRVPLTEMMQAVLPDPTSSPPSLGSLPLLLGADREGGGVLGHHHHDHLSSSCDSGIEHSVGSLSSSPHEGLDEFEDGESSLLTGGESSATALLWRPETVSCPAEECPCEMEGGGDLEEERQYMLRGEEGPAVDTMDGPVSSEEESAGDDEAEVGECEEEKRGESSVGRRKSDRNLTGVRASVTSVAVFNRLTKAFAPQKLPPPKLTYKEWKDSKGVQPHQKARVPSYCWKKQSCEFLLCMEG